MTKFSRFLASVALLLAALHCSPAAAQFADQATYVATPGGTANAITLAVQNWSRNLPGVVVRFLPVARNTGATTVVVNGVGSPIAIKKQTGAGLASLTGGEIDPAQIAEIAFDGTQWQLLAPAVIATAPAGYLTPCQVSSPSPASGCTVGQFFPTGDVASATTLYYEPVAGNAVPVYNGARFVGRAVTEQQMTLILSATANLSNHIYDVCVYSNDGTPTIGTMPGWSSFAPGAGARGTAAEIEQVEGLWVNSATATVTNNNIGVSVPPRQCTIVATIMIDGVNGQVSFTTTYGTSRRWAVWNFYNRQQIRLKAGLASGYTYNSTTVRSSGGTGTSSATVILGLPGTFVRATFQQNVLVLPVATGTSTFGWSVGIGWNSQSSFSGTTGAYSLVNSNNFDLNALGAGLLSSASSLAAGFGINTIYSLESATQGTSPGINFSATETSMVLAVEWNG